MSRPPYIRHQPGDPHTGESQTVRGYERKPRNAARAPLPQKTKRKASLLQRIKNFIQEVKDFRDEMYRKIGRFVVYVTAIAFLVTVGIGVTNDGRIKAKMAEAKAIFAQTQHENASFERDNRMNNALAFPDPGERPKVGHTAKAKRRSK